jgi:putative flippase GtrA
MGRPLADLHARVREHGPELVKFGIVGGLGTIIDLGGAAVLHSAFHEGPLESKALSITAATVFTYLGSRFWTFRHRENQPVHREAMLFLALNVAGLILAELVIAGTTYGLGLKGQLAYNAASFIGTGLGTVFRWYAYRKWVFLAPAEQLRPAPRAAAPHPEFPYYAPWELDPAYLEPVSSGWPGEHPRPVRLHNQNPVIPNGRVVSPLLTAPAPAGYSVRPAPAGPVPAGPRAPGRHRKR